MVMVETVSIVFAASMGEAKKPHPGKERQAKG